MSERDEPGASAERRERRSAVERARDWVLLDVFSALVGGNITLITVVVSLNRLLVSQEFQTPGQLQSQIANIADYRREVEAAADEVAPVKPMGFLKLLLENPRQEAQRLGGLTFGAVDDEVGDRIDDLVGPLTAQMDAVDRLRHVDVARQYFKSLYLQQELSSLSRVLLYAGIPAELVGVAFLLWLTVGGGLETLQTVRPMLPPAITVGFLPLALLISFILRTSTVTQRTAATRPSTTPEQER